MKQNMLQWKKHTNADWIKVMQIEWIVYYGNISIQQSKPDFTPSYWRGDFNVQKTALGSEQN